MRILIVEDDAKTADFITRGLKREGFDVMQCVEGRAGLQLLLQESFDAAILDIMLPGLDGLALIEQLRGTGITTPVLFLSARKSVQDRIAGLQAGGDDYLVKPFSFAELVARLRALLRRGQRPAELTMLQLADLVMDVIARKVTRAGHQIELQQREFALLEYLLRHAGRVVSKTMILEHVWGYDFDPQTNVVEARICRLRDKIDRDFDPPLIHTVRGVGYVARERR